jgi:Protein of unknown function (DUF4238)
VVADLVEASFRASPLFQELESIIECDDWGRFDRSKAKRQHFIPLFLLSRFTSLGRNGNERLCQLDVRTGRPRWVGPQTAASRRHFYAIDNERGDKNRLEAFLALVEGHAAPALARLLEAPGEFSDADRATLCFFLALMNARTPGAIHRTQSMSKVLMKAMLGTQLSDSEVFARDYRKHVDGDESDEELEGCVSRCSRT